MPFIVGEDGTRRKYSCQTCIKGHRSTKCTHHNRQLFEIKPKGRPVSQCETCRELRKSKRIHVKCTCKNREKSLTPTSPTQETNIASPPPFISPSSSVSSLSSSSSSLPLPITEPNTSLQQQRSEKQEAQQQQQRKKQRLRGREQSKNAVTEKELTSQSQYPQSNNIMHVDGDMLRIRCSRCERPQSGCVCTYDSNICSARFNKVQDTTLSSSAAPISSSPASTTTNSLKDEEDGQEMTPQSPSASSMVSQDSNNNNTTGSVASSTTSSSYGQYSNILPPLRLNLHHHSFARQSQLPIPIHDPTDDIDSDTPIYKSEENVVPDREAVLGKLSHRSSEDLLKEIYGNFTGQEKKRRRRHHYQQRNGGSGEGQTTRSDDDGHNRKYNTDEEEDGQKEGLC
ncbi:hypothetical protein INT45_013194 [Circinella minor]|uniref:Copper-fist domain-containing protein n=1 Tax=Circinella minor TaxID=1195481 RepID=A0A8H7RVW8_9FUNG|nr:hypothetical protein INT45_013194 [Circinella minor]